MKIAVVWLDAFSSKYISKSCPFISDKKETCFSSKLSPLFAYEGIKTDLDTGVSINTHKIWNDHVYNGSYLNNESLIFDNFINLIDGISPSDNINKILRFFAFKMFKREYGTPHLIFSNLLSYFSVSKRPLNHKTIYQLFNENNLQYVWIEPKLSFSEPGIFRKIPNLFSHYDVIFTKLNTLDRLGHKYGPESRIVQKQVEKYDNEVKSLIRKLSAKAIVILMSDHGMVPVYDSFDLIGFLGNEGFSFGQHFIAYIGATYVSFWFNNEKTKSDIICLLNSLKIGKVLNIEEKRLLGIDLLGIENGEEIFVFFEHTVCFPEFYHVRSYPKGMHGYAFSSYDSPILQIYGDLEDRIRLPEKTLQFVDIMPTILTLQDIPIPAYIEGHSIIE
jgi:hypothetical protein